MWIKGNPSALLVGIDTGATAIENSVGFPQKIKMKLPVTQQLKFYNSKINIFLIFSLALTS